MKKYLFFALIAFVACFSSCKKKTTHYCYNINYDSTSNIVVEIETRFEETFKNEAEAEKFQKDNFKYCEKIK